MPKKFKNKKKISRRPQDKAFFQKADLLQEWMIFHNKFPAAKTTIAGRNTIEHVHGTFLSAQRRYAKGYEKVGRSTVNIKPERFLYMKRIHPKIFHVYRDRPSTFLPALINDEWSYVFKIFQEMDRKRGITKNDYCFSFASKRPYIGDKSSSYKEHMIRAFGIAFSPLKCSPMAPVGTMQNLCSYMFISNRPNCKPSYMTKNKASPTKIVLHYQQMMDNYNHQYSSSYFPPSTVPSDIRITCEIALCSILPENIFESLKSATSQEEIVIIFQRHEYAIDTFFFGVNGKVGYNALINIVDSTYPQPRRINFSFTTAEPVHMPSCDTYCRELYIYGAEGRPQVDGRCRAMPPNISNLGLEVWKFIWHSLCPLSQVCPPNHCQVCIYNSLLKSQMRLHKDNGYKDGEKQGGTGTDSTVNSHIFGTDVIIVTYGDSMSMHLIAPPPGKTYRVSSKHLGIKKSKKHMVSTPLEHFSIYIHTAHDDEMFHHGLSFDNRGCQKQINRVRIAFIFRWLSVKRNFRCDKKDDKCNRYSMFDKYAMLQVSKHHKSALWLNSLYPDGIDDTLQKLGLHD